MRNSTRKVTLFCIAVACSSVLYAQSLSSGSNVTKADKMAGNLLEEQNKKSGITKPAPWMGHTQRTVTPVVNPLACDSVTSTFAGGNGQNGNMFDITAVTDVTITQFYGNFDTATASSGYVKVYYKSGSYMGSETTPSAWTLVDSALVTGGGSGTPTPIPIMVNVTIPMGQTYGFYVTTTGTGMDVDYTNGTTEGAVYASDANIQFKEGKGVAYPFGSNFTPRIWNGIIFYCEGIVGVNEASQQASLSLMPNPFNEKTLLTFGTTVTNGDIRIFDMLGKEVKRIDVSNASQLEIDREGLRAGVYMISISENGKTLSVRKMIIQ